MLFNRFELRRLDGSIIYARSLKPGEVGRTEYYDGTGCPDFVNFRPGLAIWKHRVVTLAFSNLSPIYIAEGI